METIFNNLIGMMLDLSVDQLQKVKTYILTRLNIVPVQSTIPVISSCHHCHGNHVIKFGKKNGKQRYFCNDCKKVEVEKDFLRQISLAFQSNSEKEK